MTRYSEEPSGEGFLRDLAHRVAVLESHPSRIPTAKLTATSGSIPSGAWTDFAFTAEEYDVDEIASVVESPMDLTLQTPGLYTVQAAITYTGNVTGDRGLRLLRTRGGVVTEGPRFGPVSSPTTLAFGMQVSWDLLCLAGDSFRLSTTQSSGGNLAVVRAHLSARYFSSTPIEE